MTLAFHLRRWPRSTKNLLDGLAGEAASFAIEKYYSMSEFDRPQTEEDFKAFIYKKALAFMAKEAKQYMTEHGGDDAIRVKMTQQGRDDGDNPLEWLKTCTRSEQEDRLEAMETVDFISELPPQLKQIASKMASGANVIECAKEIGISVEEAMSMQRAVRFIVSGFADGL